MKIYKIEKMYSAFYVLILLLIVLTQTYNPVAASEDELKEIIENHTVLVDKNTLTKQDVKEQTRLKEESSRRTSIKFGCQKQVPLYSLKKNRRIIPQTTNSPFRLILERQTIKPGEELKGSYSEMLIVDYLITTLGIFPYYTIKILYDPS